MKRQSIRKAMIVVSLLLFPITMNFLSPYLIVSGAAEGVITGSFIVFAVLFIGSLVMGRAFCGWVCPAAGLQEACLGINNKKVRGKVVNKIKYIIWLPWVAGIAFAAFSAGGFRKVNPLYMTETGISIDEPQKYFMYYGVLGLFLVLSLVMGRRASCHTICWMAPFMVLGNRIRRLVRTPALHLEVEGNKCTNCKACETKCPMSLEVNTMVNKGCMENDECILCRECVDTCPKKLIRYSFGTNGKR